MGGTRLGRPRTRRAVRRSPGIHRSAVAWMIAALVSGSLAGPVSAPVLAASPTATNPPSTKPPVGPRPGGALVVPAGAAPIVLKTSDGGAGAAALAPDRAEVSIRDAGTRPVPPATRTEVVALRNEHTRTFALPDGTYALEASPGRLNYPDGSGAWQPVDLALSATTDPTFGLKVAALDRDVSFGTGGADAGIARITTKTAGTISLAAPGRGKALATASSLAYAAASPDDASITVRPTDTGFEFGAQWPSAKANPTVDFVLDAGGLVPTIDKDGRTILLGKVGATPGATPVTTTVGVITAPVILEGGDRGDPARDQSIVSVSLIQGAGTTWTLRYALDPTWLADAARVFPVVLDPTACLGEGASGCDVNGTGVNADHFVESGSPDSYPSGWTVTRVGYDIRGWGYAGERALLYFESVALPDGALIYDSDLRLRIQMESGSPVNHVMYAYRVIDSWTQQTTWHQFGTGTGGNGYTGAYSAAATVTASGYLHWNPDAIVQSWYAHRAQGWTQNLGIALKLDTESAATGDVEFNRYNDPTAAYRPLLTIYYEVPRAQLTFDPALGTNYAPSTMLAGGSTILPIRIKNNSGFTFGAYASNANSYYDLGYRFFDQKGNLAGSNRTHLPSNLASGSTSPTIALAITVPSAAGPYSLRLDLVRYYLGTVAFASDYARPSTFYERAKYGTSTDNTRWTGNSAIERDEFAITAVSTTPPGGEWRTVTLGDDSTLAINLWSRDLAYTGSGGVGFNDLLPVALEYGYRDSAAADATGILGANGWYTNFDERFVGGAGAGDFTYQDPQGNRTAVDTNTDAQIIGGGVALARPRVTIWDENGLAASGISLGDPTNASFASPPFPAFSGTFVLKAPSYPTQGITPSGFKAIDLNQYPMARFAARTTSAASTGVAFKIHNVTNGATHPDRWFVYTLGAPFTSGDSQVALGYQAGHTTLVGDWNYYADDNLLYRVVADGNFGASTDDFQIIATNLLSSGANGGSTFIDGLRMEGRVSGGIADTNPPWTSNGTGTTTSPDTADGSLASIVIPSNPIATSPDCTGGTCLAPKNLLEFPYATWTWRKVGGGSAAVVFHLTNSRTGAVADLTYFVGPTAPAGASHPIQVADALPEGWVHVTRNLLEDARTVLNWYNDTARETHSSNTAVTSASTRETYALVGATTGSPLGPDDVSLTGYRVSGVDGSFVLIDELRIWTVPDLGVGASGHPASTGDATFTYDFSATYPDGTVHYFNPAGLLVRIRDRNDLLGGPSENRVALDWQVTPNVAGQAAFTLTAIHAPTDGTTASGATFVRRIDVGHPAGGVTFTEALGTQAHQIAGRSTAFTISAGNVTTVKPARQPACGTRAAGSGSGCVDLAYDTGHHLVYVADPRWDGTTGGTSDFHDFRYHVTYVGASTDPEAIRDGSNGDVPLVRVLNYAVAGTISPAGTRVLWQDAAAARVNAAIYTDLTSDGRTLFEYAPLDCPTADCVANPPPTTNLASQIRVAHEFDGLARVNTEIAYRCPADSGLLAGCSGSTAERVVTRQASRATARVDNFSDPLTASETAWSQTADEYAASVRDSGGGNPDLYRTTYLYDEFGRRTAITAFSANARPDYPATVTSTAQSGSALAGYWRLAESSGTSAADLVSPPHDGTYTNFGATLGAGGPLVNDPATKAPTFDGVNDYVAIPAFGPIAGTFTVETWAKPAVASGTAAYSVLGSRTTTGTTFDLKFIGGTTIHGDIGNGSAWLTTSADAAFAYTANRWYLVDYVVTPTGYTIYVDGTPVGRGTYNTGTPLLANATNPLRIGQNGLGTEYFSGSIGEVAIWTQALTASQIADHVLAGHSVAQTAAETAYDHSWRPTQVDDQYLASGGFESGFADWDFGQGLGGSVVTVPAPCDPAQPTCNIHAGLAAFSTGLTGNAQQDVALVPGQTFRFQVWTKRSSSAINGVISAYYWKKSTASWAGLTTGYANASSWTPFAWDFTLPFDTDGRVRVALWTTSGTGSDTVYYDDAAIFTSWANATYNPNGTVDRTQVLRPGQLGMQPGAALPTVDVRRTYAADAATTGFSAHPAIWPTATIANYVDGVYTPGTPDEDVASSATYDAWGRTLVAGDPDGVTTTTAYSTGDAAANGYLTDPLTVTDGVGNVTTTSYDLVANVRTVSTPKNETTALTYDLASHPLRVTRPDSTVALAAYDAYGFKTSDTANFVDGTPTAAGVDDVITRSTYDRNGNRIKGDADCASANLGVACAGTGFLDERTITTYDQLGNAVDTRAYPGSGGAGTVRTTTAYFETTPGASGTTIVRPTSSAVRAPLYPTGAPAAACPDATLPAAFCTASAVMPGAAGGTVSGLDMEGQTVGTTDAYGTVSRTFRDIAGRPVFSIANYADGIYDPAAPDTDLVTSTQYDLAGQAIRTVDVLGRATTTTRDALERPLAVTATDSAGVDLNVTKTVYTAAGRVDRVAAPDAVGLSDALRTWTRTLYDAAGRATTTLRHFDTAGTTGRYEGFEDGSLGGWSGAATGWFTGAGASLAIDATVAKAGAKSLAVTTDGSGYAGATLDLSGTTFYAGHHYRVRGWILAPTGKTADVYFGVDQSGGDAITVFSGATTGAWQLMDATWTPSGYRNAKIHLSARIRLPGGPVVFNLDDFMVTDTTSMARPSLSTFEAGVGAWASRGTGWFLASGATLSADPTDAATGRASLKMATSGDYQGAALDLSGLPYLSGHTYRLRLMFKAPAGVTVGSYAGYDLWASPNFAGSTTVATGTWQALTLDWTPNASDTSGPIHVALRRELGSTGPVVINVDDVIVWDTSASADDLAWNVPGSETGYDADGRVTATVAPPGDLASGSPMVTTTDYDPLGRAIAVTVNVHPDAAGSYEAAALANPSTAGYWRLREPAGATAVGDAAGTVNLAAGAGATLGAVGPLTNGPSGAASLSGAPGAGFTSSTLPTATTGDLSIEAWFRWSGVSTADAELIVKDGDLSTGYGVGINPTTGHLVGLYEMVAWLDTGVSPSVNVWHHVALTRSAGLTRIFLDGSPVGPTWNVAPIAPAGTFAIGLDQTGRPFAGQVAEVALYNAALTPAQVAAHYRAGSGPGSADANLTTATRYDALGRATDAIGPIGTGTRTAYDRLGRATSVIENYVTGSSTSPAHDVDVRSSFAYDALGEVTGYCTANQVAAGGCDPAAPGNAQAWHWTYDDAGHKVSEVPPVNLAMAALDTSTWTFDPGGRLTSSADQAAAGTVHRHTDLAYDGVGRISASIVYQGAGTATPRIRTTNTWLGDGAQASTATYLDGSGTASDALAFTYDPAGRPDQVKRGTTVLTDDTWNPDGTLASRVDGDAGAIGTSAFTYDWAKRLATASLPSGWQSGSNTATFGYRADGLLSTRTWNGTANPLTFTYDAAKRPIQVAKTLGSGSLSLTETYDRLGNVLSEGRSISGVPGDAGTATQAFTYDNLARLTGSSGLAAGSHAYTYDLDSNRTAKTDGSDSFAAAYDRTDELVSVAKNGLTPISAASDPFGNLTADPEAGTSAGLVTYGFDLADRTTAITPAGAATTTLALDALGRVRTRTTGARSTRTPTSGTTNAVLRVANAGGSGTTDRLDRRSRRGPPGHQGRDDRGLARARPPRLRGRRARPGPVDRHRRPPLRRLRDHRGDLADRRLRGEHDLEVPGPARPVPHGHEPV